MSSVFRFFSDWKTVVGISLSLVGIYLAFRNFDSVNFVAAIEKTDLLPIILSMIVLIFSVYIRAWRWKYLINEKRYLPLNSLFKATMVGYFGNNVLPMRLGEVMRPYFLSKIEPVSGVKIFATVVVERFLDLVGGIFLVGGLFIFFPAIPMLKLTAIALILLIGIFLFISYFFARRKEQIQDWIGKKSNRLGESLQKRIGRWIQSFYEGIEIIWKSKYYKRIILFTVILWGLYILNIWLVLSGFGYHQNLASCLLLLVMTTVAISVPSAPGYVGTYHAAAIYGLTFLGFSTGESQAISVVLHAVGFVPMTILGLFYFMKQHLTIEQVITERK